ncbi:putative TBC1 domain family member 24 [Paratrimastix pyriformis]|uniref:TBC1 domain family member 24 n=1 Tax=Paratrimastix pyriformis TaxID=342808 RepID=A0ABQ8UQJ2_9EUKA|nr:putative TBC1 domain family member 24 [Paratrimastix pyriformis]
MQNLCRKGINPADRGALWYLLSGGRHLQQEQPFLFENALEAAFESHVPARITRAVPIFGGPAHTFRHPLTPAGIDTRDRLLYLISHTQPDLEYCPALVPLVSMMLLYMSESQVFYAVSAMLNRTRSERWYFTVAKARALLYATTFRALLEQRSPKVLQHMETDLGINFPNLIESLFNSLFLFSFNYPVVHHLLDVYMGEGTKILYRVSLALFDEARKDIAAATTAKDCLEALERTARREGSQLIRKGLAIRGLAREHFVHLEQQHEDIMRSVPALTEFGGQPLAVKDGPTATGPGDGGEIVAASTSTEILQ